jgi:hypothetical protein
MIPTLVSSLKQNIYISCTSITEYYRDHLLIIYDIQSGITMGDALIA